jgi:predicted phage tail protein
LGTTVRSGSALQLESGAGTSFESGGIMQLLAPQVRVNATGSCSPAARVGDAVSPATNSIVTGSSIVCIG